MAVLRSKSVTAKVTADEYELFAAHAGDRTISEWARDVLLQATTRRSIEEALLAEVLALRTIILNLHFALATGLTPNADAMQGLIDRADREKVRKAREQLVAVGHGVYRQESQ
jgi:hypothetical protein